MSSTPPSSTSPSTETQTRTPAGSKQKLKFACDACARVKVACPKQQPECERCVSKGRRCIYSLACRSGKRSKVQVAGKSLSENDDANPQLPELATKSSSIVPFSLTSGISFTSGILHGALWQPADHTLTSVERSDLFSTNNQYEDFSTYQYPDSYFTSNVRPITWPQQPTSQLFTSPSSYTGEPSADSTPPSSDPGCSYSPTADAEAALLSNHELPHLPAQPQDNCFTRTYFLLHTLKRPSNNVCHFESADPLQPTNSESIDKILSNTDKAIEHVASVMQCSCHTTSSVRCALTLALLEVISWYETIVRQLNTQQQQYEKPTSSHSSCPSWSSSDEYYDTCISGQSDSNSSTFSNMGPGSVPTVAIGGMQLARTDAKGVLKYLVLSRIRKVRGIVQSLSMDGDFSMLSVERLDSVTEEFVKMGEITA
jgi:Aflatoxin regulatory protein